MIWKISSRTSSIIKGKITPEMIDIIAVYTENTINQKEKRNEKRYMYPNKVENRNINSENIPIQQKDSFNLVTLNSFITNLVIKSKVQVGTLICTLVYLNRLKKRLPKGAKGIPCTYHRIFLASLIIAGKYLNDASPKNKYWARYSNMFSIAEVNLMEKQFLFLLDFDLRIEAEDLEFASEHFYSEKLNTIKQSQYYLSKNNIDFENYKNTFLPYTESKNSVLKTTLPTQPDDTIYNRQIFKDKAYNPFNSLEYNATPMLNDFTDNSSCIQVPQKSYINPSHTRSLSSIQFDKVKI
ncbi:hypothetical protein BB561_002102 [Smittium simulii]|uniref:Cyclin N-terminal domain-containing protein n=1 Tax=Smittium simulii TaxID=133385 RepID=A0A2T9YRN8_9FUNG|nr:hypothetical protein BB561_002102 [Smittium simulii]